VCNLPEQVLLGLASTATLRSKSRRIGDHILVSHLRLGPLFVTSYDSQGGYDGRILTRLNTGTELELLLVLLI
jgi:hypothetical protein